MPEHSHRWEPSLRHQYRAGIARRRAERRASADQIMDRREFPEIRRDATDQRAGTERARRAALSASA